MGSAQVERRRLAVALLVSLAAMPFTMIGSCGGTYLLPEQRTEDSGATHDANRSFSDAAPQAGDDGGPPQVGVDDFVKGWVHSPWAGSCALYQPATDAQLAKVPPFHWTACPSGRADCLILVPDWPATAYHQLIQTSERTTPADSVEVMTSRQYTAYHDEIVIWDGVGVIEAAWRSNGDANDCLHFLGDISAGEDALSVATRRGDEFPEYRQIFGSATEMRAKTTPDYNFAPTDIGFAGDAFLLSTSSASATTVVMDGDLGAAAIRDRATNEVALVYPLQADYDKLVGDADFFATSGAIYAWTHAQGAALVHSPPSGSYLHDLTADESTLLWLESTNFDTPSAVTTLYTSPFATTAAQLAPKAVRTIPCKEFCESVVSEGYAVVGLDPVSGLTRELLLRLSDGAYWILDSGSESWGLGKVLNGEVWIPTKYDDGDSIERISLSSLGEPSGD